jgi:uncharacterized hydrophobic protein (TIGR00271 family)
MQMEQRPSPQSTGRIGSVGDLLHGGRVERADLDDLADKLWFDREGRDAYVRFGVLLVLSVLIATGGVLADSTATVIGAMIVAPLMTPIMASALAVVAGDLTHLGRSLALVLAGVALAIGLSFLFAWASPIVVNATANSQVAGRVSPRLTDLIVALASGAAGAFALSRRNVSDALPGVAIAISLVPPLCVVGVMLANHDAHAASEAALLFTTNFLAIMAAGGGLLAIMGYGRVALASGVRGRRAAAVSIAIATLIVAVPLAITGSRITRNVSIEFQIQAAATSRLPFPYELVSVDANGGLIDITVEGPPGDITDMANKIATEAHARYPDATVRVALLAGQVVEIGPATAG